MEEASKAAKAEARKKSGSQTPKKDPAESSNKPAAASEAPAPTRVEAPKAASLFDSALQPARGRETNVPASGGTRPPFAASETDEDEEILREADTEGEAEEGDEAA